MGKIILAEDGCAVYAETDYGRFPVEPLNSVSNLVFLVVIIYWVRKVRFKFGRYPLIVTLMPVFFIGLIAGFMHHAFRSEKMWNTICILAVFYAVIMACVYFWYRILGKWFNAFFCTMMIPFLLWGFFVQIEGSGKITVWVIFIAMSIAVLVPSLVYCIKYKLKNIELLALASFLFAIGMFCRKIDMSTKDIFSHGTHFLWHIFAASAIFVFLKYVYLVDEERAGGR